MPKTLKPRKRQTGVTFTPMTKCCNCGQFGSHYVPPSLDEQGFYMCKKAL